MTNIEKESWGKIRAMGHGRFIARAIFRIGILSGVVLTLVPFLFDVFRHEATSSASRLTVEFVLWSFCFGYGIGESRWQVSEIAYLKPTDDENVA